MPADHWDMFCNRKDLGPVYFSMEVYTTEAMCVSVCACVCVCVHVCVHVSVCMCVHVYYLSPFTRQTERPIFSVPVCFPLSKPLFWLSVDPTQTARLCLAWRLDIEET